jgi:hypothetical protein
MSCESKKYLSKLLAGVLIAAAAMAGIYAVAASTASSVAASIVTDESTQRTRITDFAVAVKRASVEQREARAKCKTIQGAKRSDCNTLARAEQKRAVEDARERWSRAAGRS